MALAGGFEFDDGPIGHVVVRNITPDPETGIGKWTEAEIVTALRNGKRPDDTVIGPPMPIRFYRQLSDRDAAAIAAYLRSLRPISHAVERTRFKNPPPVPVDIEYIPGSMLVGNGFPVLRGGNPEPRRPEGVALPPIRSCVPAAKSSGDCLQPCSITTSGSGSSP